MAKRTIGGVICFILMVLLSACEFKGLDGMHDFSNVTVKGSEANKLLYYAISETPNTEAIKEAIDRGADANQLLTYPLKSNVLYYYSQEHMGEDIFYNHTGRDIAEYLIENGADPNFVLKDGVNLLMYSCGAFPVSGAGIDVLFDLLINAGADVNATDKSGLSALDYAITCSNSYKVERLLAHGATYNEDTLIRLLTTFDDSEDPTTLSQKIRIANMLLTDFKQTSASIPSNTEAIRLCIASVNREQETVISTLQSEDFNFDNGIPYAASILLAGFSTQDIVKMIESEGCSFTVEHLYAAIGCGNYDVSIYLQPKFLTGLQSLRLSIQFGQPELTYYFLELAQNLGELDFPDHTEFDSLLIDAIKSGNLDVVRTIYNYGKPYTSDTLYQALQEAIYMDQPEILEFLINYSKFDINYCADGKMPLFEIAILHGNYDIFCLLLQNESLNIDSSSAYLYDAIIKDNNAALKDLLEMNIDPNGGDPADNPLAEAIHRGNMEAVDLLIDAGADVNLKLIYSDPTSEDCIESFSYPIHEAARGLSYRVLQKMIDAGGETSLIDSEGKTPLDVAVTSYNIELLETYKQHFALKL